MHFKPKIANSNPDSINAIEFNDILDLDEIQKFQDLFSAATGVLSLITHPDGTPITKPSNSDGLRSDLPQKVIPCLERNTRNTVARINVGEKHIADWLICQDRFDDLDNQPKMSADQFTKVANMLFAFASELSEKAFSNFQLKLQIEERNSVKEKMLEIEWFNRRIVETTNEGIWAMDSDYHTTYINSKMAEMLGYSVDEIMAMRVTDFIFSEDHEDHLQRRVQRMSGKSGFYERRFKRKDGTEIWTIVSSTAIIDTDGTFMGSFGMIMDMSTRKNAEISLAQSEEKFRLIAENTSDGILLIDSSQRILFASPAADRMMGAEPGETMKVDSTIIFNFIHPEDRDATFNKIFQAISNRVEDLVYTYRVMHQNGKYIWREDHAKFTYDQAGNHLKTIVIAQDITERKQAEEEILERKARYRGLSEASFESIFISEKGVCIEQNQTAEKMFGYTTEEALGRYGTDWIVPDDRAMVMDKMLKGDEDPYEATALKKDGTTFPCMLRGKMMSYKGKNVRVTSLSDISAQKKAENEIIALNKELDQRVKLRTAELETAIKELETFSYSISHDLKAPLRHITGFLGLFLENKSTKLTEEELGYLNNISGSAVEMGQLIDAILSFSRLSQAELRKTNIHSAYMVQQVIGFFQPEIQNRNITFHVESLPDIEGDEGLIRQVWTNLISNAIKYTSKLDEAVIEIGSSSADGLTTFFIKDNGAGFNMKYVEKLFKVFQRLHKSRDFEGVGIGLANVNRIITRHGGHCRAEGEPDKGAVFYFTLPD
ncbi:MAG: PAS domain S-box protein [Bacteroidota bacterium]